MIDESCLFDSEEEEEDEAKKKTPEERKFLFRRELRSMLYGFGDEKVNKSWSIILIHDKIKVYKCFLAAK